MRSSACSSPLLRNYATSAIIYIILSALWDAEVCTSRISTWWIRCKHLCRKNFAPLSHPRKYTYRTIYRTRFSVEKPRAWLKSFISICKSLPYNSSLLKARGLRERSVIYIREIRGALFSAGIVFAFLSRTLMGSASLEKYHQPTLPTPRNRESICEREEKKRRRSR